MVQSEDMTAPRSLKERQRQEREALILQVAEAVLMEKGYYETSIDEIASRVGIAKGTVYLHFPSKDDLAVAILTQDIRQLIEQVEKIVAVEGSAQSKLESILQSLYGKFIKRMQLISEMFHSSTPLQFKEHGKKVLGLWEHLVDLLNNLLEEGKATGEFTSDIPTAVMTGAFFGLMSPGSYKRLKLGENISGDELARHLGRIYCHGICNGITNSENGPVC